MRKFFVSFFLAAFSALVISCTDDLNSRIDDIEDRLSKLEEIVNRLNDDVASLQRLIDGSLFIKSVNDNGDGSYTITFVDSEGNVVSATTIGDGEDGVSPQISIRKGEDGEYYWTMNGEWLLDDEGNRIPVAGKNGVTPIFKIVEEYWYISYDGGNSWDRLGKASGDSQGLITDVVISEDGSQVVLTLSDGTEVVLDLFGSFDITFEGLTGIAIEAGKTVNIPFELSGATSETQVVALPGGLWKASVEIKEDYSGGTVSVTAPESEATGNVVVLASDGAKQTIMRALSFKEGFLTIANTIYSVPGKGGEVEVKMFTNLDNYRFYIPTEDRSWILRNSTKAAEHEESVYFTVQPNETGEQRSTSIEISDQKKTMVYNIIVTQMTDQVTDLSAEGKANCYIVPAAGAYKFSASTRGNSSTVIDVQNPAADFLWVDGSSSVNMLLSNIEYNSEDKTISFLSTGVDGNAVVVLYDSETMRIAYSWHLWFVDGGVRDITTKTAGVWMDRNLGALGNTKEDEWKAYGLLWQWGRKDPFIGSNAWEYDDWGTEKKAFEDLTAPNYINPKFAQEHSWKAVSAVGQFETIDASLAYPMRFVCKTAGDAVWTDEMVLYTWRNADGSKGVYDPCPAGYHVPDYDEFANPEKEGSLAYDMSNGGAVVPYLGQNINNGGYYVGNGAENEMWMPAVPYRTPGVSSGRLSAFGKYGTYWTSQATEYDEESGSAYKYNSYVSSDILKFSTRNSSSKAGGYSIRCVRD